MGNNRLLIIEDDIDIAELLLHFFGNQGYEVFHADMGQEGIAIARSKFPNLILLDVMLPDMVGFDICRALRTTNLTKYIPIIFLTQRDARADKVAGLELGADDYITKPFDIEELRLRIQSSIRRATRDHLHETRTGFPGGPLIREEFERLRNQDGWHYYNIHLAGFNALRTHYGFLVADEAIALAASIIRETVAAYGTPNDFMGISDDKFIIFTHAPEIKTFTETLTETYKNRVRTLYNFVDSERGYLILAEGTPQESQEPLLHLVLTPYTSDQANA